MRREYVADEWMGVDARHRFSLFPLEVAINEGALCWNGMTPEQQKMLAVNGLITHGEYGGGPCLNLAEVAIETGDFPGKRYYCISCAEKVLA